MATAMLWPLGTSVAIFNIRRFIAQIEFKVLCTLFWLTFLGHEGACHGGLLIDAELDNQEAASRVQPVRVNGMRFGQITSAKK
jgi:hypothetical protein